LLTPETRTQSPFLLNKDNKSPNYAILQPKLISCVA